MSRAPTVSIVTITYNQQEYIRKALESIVSQEVDFGIEVIVSDDGSNDRTQLIIKEFAEKYPEIIRPILRRKNIGAYENFKDALQHVTGKYLAMCEGDDYWTDSKKLQKQVNFMEKHPSYALCFHPVRVFFESRSKPDYVFPDPTTARGRYTVENLLRDNFIQTNSVLYKSLSYEHLPKHVLPADWYMHLYHAKHGRIGYINEVMAAYRRHETGLWGGIENPRMFWEAHGLNFLNSHKEFLSIFSENNKYRDIIYESASRVFDSYASYARKTGQEHYLTDAVTRFPDFTTYYILRERIRLKETEDVLGTHKRELVQAADEIRKKEEHIKNIETKLSIIECSRIWRTVQLMKRII